MKMLILTHDLSCTIGDLDRAARKSSINTGPRCSTQLVASEPLGAVTKLVASEPLGTVTDLAVAAIAFTIQLAIDTTDRDPTEMRALEHDLIGKLKAAP